MEYFKGIFWFTCSFDENEKCDFEDAELITALISVNDGFDRCICQKFNSKNGTTFTHENTWAELVKRRKDLRRHSWNYFPRGRVEIRNHKAVIFMNPNILECPQYKEMIIRKFCLEKIKTKVTIDNSVHYNCHAENVTIR